MLLVWLVATLLIAIFIAVLINYISPRAATRPMATSTSTASPTSSPVAEYMDSFPPRGTLDHTAAASAPPSTTSSDVVPAKVIPADKRVCVIVGASSGIGAAIANLLSSETHVVVLAARRVENLRTVEEECRTAGATDVLVHPTDATDQASCGALIQATIQSFGRIDSLYYVAGQAMHVLFKDITNLDLVMSKMMGVNFYGAVWCTYYALPHLQASRGNIIVVSSVAGDISPPYLSFYAAAKHAVHGFFESLQNEECGVGVTIALPGYVATEIEDKKIVGDGSAQRVDLNTTPSKYMTVKKAAELIVDAGDKRKKKYHLTSLGSLGSTLHAIFPGLINSAVRNEMQSITKDTNASQ